LKGNRNVNILSFKTIYICSSGITVKTMVE
jgi:hypothetical protein